MELRPYQKHAIEAITAYEALGVRRQLLVMATGLGKTVVFCSLPKVRANSTPMLVLAHREELLDQAAAKVIAINPELTVSKEQADSFADLSSDVVVASVPTLGREGSSRIERFPRDHFKVVVVDEAHHAAASTYRRILDYFLPDLTLGVTATPQRGDNVRLSDVFDEVVFHYSILEGMKADFLTPLVGYRLQTKTDISGVKRSGDDYVVADLSKAVNTPERNKLVVEAYKEYLHDRPTFVFATDIEHAEALQVCFSFHNISSAVILGTTSSGDRNLLLRKFREGSLNVIINVGVLTEGVDEPSVSGIILARPIGSPLLYTQIVGRGTRLANDKPNCVVIDLADSTRGKKPLGLPSVVGLPPDFDLAGKDLLEAEEVVAKLADKSPEEASRVRSFSDIDLAYKRIDLFFPPAPSPTVLEHSRFVWAELSEGHYCLNAHEGDRVYISQDDLGTYSWHSTSNPDSCGKHILTLRDVFAAADNYVIKTYPDQLNLITIDSQWRGDGPTEKQLKFLKRKGIPVTSDMTKGTASQIIQRWIDEHPRSQAQKAIIDRAKRNRMGSF